MTDRTLCTWRVRSELPLRGLRPWRGDDRPADLVIRRGVVEPVHELVHELVHDGPLLQIRRDGRCRFAIAGVAVYGIDSAGTEVIVETALDPGAPDVGAFLFGTVFGLVCHKRGLVPLHASCVQIGEHAIALAGVSGEGKSTLAAAFQRRGHRVLADDVTVVHAGAPDGPAVLPSIPRLKLWQDAMDTFGLPADGLEPVRPHLKKFNVHIDHDFSDRPVRLAAIYHLRAVSERRLAGMEPLRGVAAVGALVDSVYRRLPAVHMGRREFLVAETMRLSTLPSMRLARLPGLGALDATVAEIAARHE